MLKRCLRWNYKTIQKFWKSPSDRCLRSPYKHRCWWLAIPFHKLILLGGSALGLAEKPWPSVGLVRFSGGQGWPDKELPITADAQYFSQRLWSGSNFGKENCAAKDRTGSCSAWNLMNSPLRDCCFQLKSFFSKWCIGCIKTMGFCEGDWSILEPRGDW